MARLFSFNEIKDISVLVLFLPHQKMPCFLKYFRQSNKTTTTVDGLSGQTISSL
jgi:hypothetical protein